MLVANLFNVTAMTFVCLLPFLVAQTSEKSFNQGFLLVLSTENTLPDDGIHCFCCHHLDQTGDKRIILFIFCISTNCSDMTLLRNKVWHCGVAMSLRKQTGIDETV